MRLQVIQCDNCEKWIQDVHMDREIALPRSWLMLLQENSDTQHFCSLLCLRGKILRMFNEVQPDNHTPYPYCCAEHYPLPERTKS